MKNTTGVFSAVGPPRKAVSSSSRKKLPFLNLLLLYLKMLFLKKKQPGILHQAQKNETTES